MTQVFKDIRHLAMILKYSSFKKIHKKSIESQAGVQHYQILIFGLLFIYVLLSCLLNLRNKKIRTDSCFLFFAMRYYYQSIIQSES